MKKWYIEFKEKCSPIVYHDVVEADTEKAAIAKFNEEWGFPIVRIVEITGKKPSANIENHG